MQFPRLPRFKRSLAVTPMQVTARDREIIRLVYRHRFLRSSQILALIGDTSPQLLRRLQLLYHHGYLERPHTQLDYYHHGGSRHMVYGLGNKSAALLKRELGSAFHPRPWGEKNRSVGRIFLNHALLISDIMVTLELACRTRGDVRFLTETELVPEHLNGAKNRSFRWKVKLENGSKLSAVPDRVFALEFPNGSGELERRYFLLEADRGTMPVIRRNFSQTSFYRKLLAYEASWSQSLLERRFGINRFRVITITTSAARVDSLANACSQLQRGKGLFLFAHRDVLNGPNLLSETLWRTCKGAKLESLLG